MLAPAKVNLFLHVGAPLADGRHPLDSLVVFAGREAADRLEIEAAEDLSLEVSGPYASEAGPDADNLVLKAARALKARAGVTSGARVSLDKQLPAAAGIGGGSADAGASLRMLCALWGVELKHAEAIAPKLGGDVLAALGNSPCLMRGDGDRVQAVPGLPPLAALLVNPGVACSTGAVFDDFDRAGSGASFEEITGLPDFGQGAEASGNLINWLATMRNDLEDAAKARVPEIGAAMQVMSALPGALLTRMSGSGATCFALFADMDAAQAAERQLSAGHPGWWVRATTLGVGA